MKALRLVLLLAAVSASLGARTTQRRSLRAEDAAPSIVNGYYADAGRYPYMASLREAATLNHFCGGTLIHDRIVMTAAHCVVDQVLGWRLEDRWHPVVRIGGIDPQNNAMLDYEERQVIATYVHPGFTFGSVFELKPWMNNDVALMLLDKPSSKRRPRLPQYKAKPQALVAPNTPVRGLGYGRMRATVAGPVPLQWVDMLWLDAATCSAAFKDIYPFPFADNSYTQTCVGNPKNYRESFCIGDSGSATILPATSDNPANDIVVGVVSFSSGECGKFPVVMTSVSQLRPWVDATIATLLRGDWSASWTRNADGTSRVRGFDDSIIKRPKAKLGDKDVTVLSTFHASITARADMTTMYIRVGSNKVTVYIATGQTFLLVNAEGPLPQLTTTPLKGGGSVKYDVFSGSNVVTVTLADSVGMAIKVTQPYVWSSGTYRNYFDLTVSYTQLPGLPLRGVLGPTFPVRTAFKMGKRDSWTGEP